MPPPDSTWFARRLRATRWLVLAGMLLSYASYGVFKLGGPRELYPFFYWRLYSAPVDAHAYATYRVYTRSASDAGWHRHPVAPSTLYSRKGYFWQLESLTTAFRAAPTERNEARLRLFAETVVPDAAAYRIVAESFDPRALVRGHADYDTTTVFQFTR